MWQRFTERARKVIFYAQEEAGRLGRNDVSTEHLLLGLVREDDSVAVRILIALGVSTESVRLEVERQSSRGEGRLGNNMQLTDPAKRVIDNAYDEARHLGNNYIGTEHLLLGMIRQSEGVAARVLATLGIDLEGARRQVLALQEGPGAKASVASSADASLPATPNQIIAEVMALVRRAEAEAIVLERPIPGLEHLLLAIMADGQSVAARLLAGYGITLENMRQSLKDIYAADPDSNPRE